MPALMILLTIALLYVFGMAVLLGLSLLLSEVTGLAVDPYTAATFLWMAFSAAVSRGS